MHKPLFAEILRPTNMCKTISGGVPTCDSVHSWRLYSASPLRDQAISTMTQYLTQSHYHEPQPTSRFPILRMPSTWLASGNYQLLCHLFDSTKVRPCEFKSNDLSKQDVDAQLIESFGHNVRDLRFTPALDTNISHFHHPPHYTSAMTRILY